MSVDGQGTKSRSNIAENFNRLSRAHERYRQTTDRRTGDSIMIYSERERDFTFAKNRSTFGEVVGKGMVVNFGSQCNIRH